MLRVWVEVRGGVGGGALGSSMLLTAKQHLGD